MIVTAFIKEFALVSKKRMEVYKWILSYLTQYIVPLTFFIFCVFFISGVTLAIPKFIQYCIDVVFPNKDVTKFIFIMLIVGILLITKIIITCIKNRIQRFLQEKPSMDILQSLFIQLRKLGFSYYEQHPTGETLSLFRDEVNNIQSIYRKYIPGIIYQGVLLIISTATLINTSITLSLIVIPCFLSYYLFGPYFEKKSIIWAKKAQNRRIKTNKRLFNSISALLELRAFGSEKWDLSQLEAEIKKQHKAETMDNINGYARGTLRRFTTGLGAFVIFVAGVNLVKNGDLSTGEFVAFSILYFTVIFNMTMLVTYITEQRIYIIQAEKLYQFMQKKPNVKETVEPFRLESVNGKVSFHDVHFSYSNQQKVINGINLVISPGEKVALVGHSGNGKTTLIKLIGRFYDPIKGEILIDDIPLKELSFSQLRESIGFVFQETFLFGTSIKENIRFGNPEASEDEVIQAAKAAFAHEFIMEMPEQYETLVGERGIKLSGGQKQRIAIARMFIKNPSVIILDEATSALDNNSEYQVQQALERLMYKRTTIAIAHRLSTVRNYNRIVVIENGRVAEIGSYDELIVLKGAFYRLLMKSEETPKSAVSMNE